MGTQAYIPSHHVDETIYERLGGERLARVGRILYAMPFAVFGALHLSMSASMAATVPGWVPGPHVVWVYLTGVAMIASALAIAADRFSRIAGLVVAGLMALFVLTVHIPGLRDPAVAQMAMVALLKDTALLGAALMVAGRSRAPA
jgi:uncharacterized membrane protein